jgi:hypothetical protein
MAVRDSAVVSAPVRHYYNEIRDPVGSGGVARTRWIITVDNKERLAYPPLTMPRKKKTDTASPATAVATVVETAVADLSPALRLAHALEPKGGETLAQKYHRLHGLIVALRAAGEPVPAEIEEQLPGLDELLAAYPVVQRHANDYETEREQLSKILLAQYAELGVPTFFNADGAEVRKVPGRSPAKISAEKLVEKGVTAEVIAYATVEGKPYDSLRVFLPKKG